MRVQSAARAKEKFCRGPSPALPREGTKRRELYDYLQANKGNVITVSFAPGHGKSELAALQDFYGLDIRRIRHRQWVLAGEWFGSEYCDYIAERLQGRTVTDSGPSESGGLS